MIKKLVIVLGVVLTLVGLLGFVNNPVVGLFPVNVLHNLVHVLTGVLLLVFAMRGEAGAILIAKVFGVVYALVTILGFVVPSLMMDLLAIDSADNYLHLLLALVFLGIGFGTKPKMAGGSM